LIQLEDALAEATPLAAEEEDGVDIEAELESMLGAEE
jgi:hypothetical protein